MDDQWKRQLRREASVHHMCAENRSALEVVDSMHEAIELYKKTIDWALEEGYPNMQTLRKYFSHCEDFGIYIDTEFHGEVLNQHQVYVFHNCSGTIRTGLNLGAKIIPMMYFANGCDMNVRGIPGSGTQARVPLYVFGYNHVAGETSDDIVCKIYSYDVK